MRRCLFAISFIIILGFASCEKKEPLYPRPDVPKGTITRQIGMGPNYEQQVYFDFETGKYASVSPYTWDIAFSREDDNKIIINGGKNGEFSACNLGKISFSDPIDLNGIEDDQWKHDNPSGDIDSTALGNVFTRQTSGRVWETDSNMYLIKLGPEKDLGEKAYVKLRILYRNGEDYQIEWNYWQKNMSIPVPIPTFEDKNYTYFCFECGSLIENEPMDNDEWHIVFTRYKQEIYYAQVNATEGYTVTGVLSNMEDTKTANLTGMIDYNDITISNAKGIDFNDNLNNIGYEWKTFSIQANKYTINPKNAFVVKSRRGLYYKVKFIDFYNDQDETGYPKFAYELLQ